MGAPRRAGQAQRRRREPEHLPGVHLHITSLRGLFFWRMSEVVKNSRLSGECGDILERGH